MNGLSLDKASDWLLLVAALVTSMVVFSLLFRIIRAIIVPVIMLAVVAIVLQLAFDISPTQLVNMASRMGQSLWQKIA